MPTHGGLEEENEKNAKAQCFSIFLLVYERGAVRRKQGCVEVLVLLGILVETLNQHVKTASLL